MIRKKWFWATLAIGAVLVYVYSNGSDNTKVSITSSTCTTTHPSTDIAVTPLSSKPPNQLNDDSGKGSTYEYYTTFAVHGPGALTLSSPGSTTAKITLLDLVPDGSQGCEIRVAMFVAPGDTVSLPIVVQSGSISKTFTWKVVAGKNAKLT